LANDIDLEWYDMPDDDPSFVPGFISSQSRYIFPGSDPAIGITATVDLDTDNDKWFCWHIKFDTESAHPVLGTWQAAGTANSELSSRAAVTAVLRLITNLGPENVSEAAAETVGEQAAAEAAKHSEDHTEEVSEQGSV
jgi:hypothetical protein